jgi:hypothetical protein
VPWGKLEALDCRSQAVWGRSKLEALGCSRWLQEALGCKNAGNMVGGSFCSHCMPLCSLASVSLAVEVATAVLGGSFCSHCMPLCSLASVSLAVEVAATVLGGSFCSHCMPLCSLASVSLAVEVAAAALCC